MKKIIKTLLRKLGIEIQFIKNKQAEPDIAGELDPEYNKLPLQVLSIEYRSVFFGYHDKTPFSSDGTKVLGSVVKADDTNPESQGSVMDIGFFRKNSENNEFKNDFIKISETATWSWQQGCMLQWNPAKPDREIIFNNIVNNNYGSVIYDVESKKLIKEFDLPVYSLDLKGNYASSLNFGRLGRLRPGYGYNNYPDPALSDTNPQNDGIFLVNLSDGKSELIVTLAELADYTDKKADHYINHITFSPSGEKIAFFHIYPDHSGNRLVRFYVYSITDRKLNLLEASNRVSHYCWRDDNQIFTSEGIRNGCLYFLYDLHRKIKTRISLPDIGDIHPMFNPVNKDIIVADTKPGKTRNQHMFLFNIRTGDYKKIGTYYSPREYAGEVRCDLHPRFDRTGDFVNADVILNGRRSMVIINVSSVF
jgi:hypothetical protein